MTFFAHRHVLTCSVAPIALMAAAPALAQDAPPVDPVAATAAPEGNQPEVYADDIVVRATRLKGEVDTDIPVLDEISAAEVASYGATSITELIGLLGPQTGSSRGRGGGRPVILLNGRRISNFRELRDLPPEAIARVQIFPEELALQYGYRPDQRVINLILVSDFASVVGELEYGQPAQGGRSKQEAQGGLTRIGDDFRFNLNAQYTQETSLTEAERGIVASALRPNALLPTGVAGLGAYRTLLPQTDAFQLNASYSKNLTETIVLSLNAAYDIADSRSLNGLPAIDFLLPGTSAFSQTGQDAAITRYYTDPQPLRRSATVDTRSASAGISGDARGWRWSVNGNYSEVLSDIFTDRALDAAGVQALVAAGLADPFAAATGQGLAFAAPDRSRSLSTAADGTAEGSGVLFSLPAGAARISLNGGYNRQDISAVTQTQAAIFATDLGRGTASFGGNISLPISSRRDGVLEAIGDLTLNANGGYKHLTDFGDLKSYGGGLTWEPTENLRLLMSYIGEEAAPSISDLGAPIILTPNVPTFDFTTGQSVVIDRTTGGNPALIAERRGDIKVNLGWEPGFVEDLRIEVEYNRNRSRNVTSSFPLLTPAIEAAFASRVTRGPDNRLLALDARPVTYGETNRDRIRWGLNYRGAFGGNSAAEGGGGEGADGAGGGRRADYGSGRAGGGDGGRRGGASGGATASHGAPGGKTAAASSAAPGAAGTGSSGQSAAHGGMPANGTETAASTPQEQTPQEQTPQGQTTQGQTTQSDTPQPRQNARRGGGGRGGFGFGRPDDGKGRYNISLYHTYALRDDVVIRPGVPTLDLLNGDATGAAGGTPRHQLELESGVYYKGMGLRFSGNYASATRVNGDPLTGSSDLYFGDLATFNLRLFANLEQVLKKDRGVFKGTRVSSRVDNLFGAIQEVRDASGAVPLRYQPGLVDPVGRVVEIDFRKRF